MTKKTKGKLIVFCILGLSVMLNNGFAQDDIENKQETIQTDEIYTEIINDICKFLPETLEVKKSFFKRPEMKIFTKMVMCSLSTFDTKTVSYIKDVFEFTNEELNKFVMVNKEASQINLPENALENLYILSKVEYKTINWENIQTKFPSAAGFCGCSKIGYSEDKRKAVVYFFRSYGPLAGGGFFSLFKNEDGKWKKVKTIQTWKS